MFKGIKSTYQADKVSYFIEWATTDIVNKLISQGIHVKTHDTIFIFKVIWSYTINLYVKIKILEYDRIFIEEILLKTKENLYPWLVKILNVGTSENIIQNIRIIIEKELDEHCDVWIDGYLIHDTKNHMSLEKYGSRSIFEYLSNMFKSSINDMYEEFIYRILLRIKTELTKNA